MRQRPETMTLRERAEAIRWPVKRLAKAAGLDRSTVQRILDNPKGSIVSNVERVERAIHDEEQRLLAVLVDGAAGRAIEGRVA